MPQIQLTFTCCATARPCSVTLALSDFTTSQDVTFFTLVSAGCLVNQNIWVTISNWGLSIENLERCADDLLKKKNDLIKDCATCKSYCHHNNCLSVSNLAQSSKTEAVPLCLIIHCKIDKGGVCTYFVASFQVAWNPLKLAMLTLFVLKLSCFFPQVGQGHKHIHESHSLLLAPPPPPPPHPPPIVGTALKHTHSVSVLKDGNPTLFRDGRGGFFAAYALDA